MLMKVSNKKFEKERDYWINKLNADIEVTGFPLDYYRSRSQRYVRKTLKQSFSSEEVEKLTFISNKSDYGLFMILLSGVEYVLKLYTESNKILVIMPVFKQPDTKGELMNSILPLLTDVKECKTFKQLLSAIKNTVIEANNNQNFPILNIINAINIETADNGLHIVKTAALFDSIHSEDYLGGIVTDFLFQFSRTGDALEISLHYNSLLYKQATADCILEYIMHYLNVVLTDPGVKLHDIEKSILKMQNSKLEYLSNSDAKILNNFDSSDISFVDMIRNYPAAKHQSNAFDAGSIKKYILGKDGDLKPIGITGEICVAEDFFSKNDFKTKPFEEVSPSYQNIKYGKLYKTGCMAKWLADGSIEYTGRINQYLSIKGCNVNLHEMELQLLEFEDIKAVKVIQKKNGKGQKVICAYYVSDNEITIENVKAYLAAKMQADKIPEYFIRLENIPFDENGILDEALLPGPFADIDKSNPTLEVEELLTGIWKGILGDQEFETTDDFFDLGGNSLLAIKLEVELEKNSISFPSRQVFTNRTIKDQTSYICRNN